MGSPGQTPDDLFRAVGSAMSPENAADSSTNSITRRWSSEGKMIKAPDSSTILTPEQRYKRDWGEPRPIDNNVSRGHPLWYRQEMQKQRMAEYQKQYETEIKGGLADPELGLTTIQYG